MTASTLLIAAVAVAACGGAPAGSATPAPIGNVAPDGVRVQLVDPGAEPRQLLRYNWTLHRPEYLEVDVKQATESAITDTMLDEPLSMVASLPTIRTTVRLEAVERTASGGVRLESTTVAVRLLDDAPLDPVQRTGMEAAIASSIGLRVTADISPQGVLSDFQMVATPAMEGNPLLQALEQAMRNAYSPLPVEPVGVGARWNVSLQMPLMGAAIDVTYGYTVLRLDATSVTLKASFLATAAVPQTLALPGGGTGMLESFRTRGDGTSELSLTRLSARAHMTTTMTSRFSIADTGAARTSAAAQIESEITMRPSGIAD